MGENTLPDYPEIDSTKYYCLTTEFYTDLSPTEPCGYQSTQSCCLTGLHLKWSLNQFADFGRAGGACYEWFPCWELLVDITGPYNTLIECEGVC